MTEGEKPKKRIPLINIILVLLVVTIIVLLIIALLIDDTYDYSAGEWVQEGRFFYDKSLYEIAITNFDKAIKVDPAYSQAYRWRGYSLYGLTRYEEALADFETALELNPSDTNMYRWKGYTLYRLERYEEALFELNTAIEIDPSDAILYNWKGRTLERLGREEEAIEAYDYALVLDPSYSDARENRDSLLKRTQNGSSTGSSQSSTTSQEIITDTNYPQGSYFQEPVTYSDEMIMASASQVSGEGSTEISDQFRNSLPAIGSQNEVGSYEPGTLHLKSAAEPITYSSSSGDNGLGTAESDKKRSKQLDGSVKTGSDSAFVTGDVDISSDNPRSQAVRTNAPNGYTATDRQTGVSGSQNEGISIEKTQPQARVEIKPYTAEGYDDLYCPVTRESIKKMVQEGRKDDALQSVNLMIENNRQSPLLHKAKGDILRTSSPEKALESYQYAQAMCSSDPNLYSRKADLEQRLGRDDMALETCMAGLVRNPNDTGLIQRRTELEGSVKQAVSQMTGPGKSTVPTTFGDLNSAVSQQGSIDGYLADQAGINHIGDLVAEGRIDEAVVAVQTLITRYPNDPRLYQMKGELLKDSSPEVALESFRLADMYGSQSPMMASRKGDDAGIGGNISGLLEKNGQGPSSSPGSSNFGDKDGDETLQSGAEREAGVSNPVTDVYEDNLGDSSRIIENVNQVEGSGDAVPLYDSTFNGSEQNSSQGWLGFGTGTSHEILDKGKGMVADSCPDPGLRSSSRLMPVVCKRPCDPFTKEPITHMIETGKKQEAIRALNRLIDAHPLTSCLYKMKGDLLIDDSPTVALYSYELAAVYGYDDPDLFEKMGDTSIRFGNYQKALDSYQRGLALDPFNPSLLEKQGRLFLREGKFQQALRSFDEALICNRDPVTERDIRREKIDILQKMGRSSDIILELNKLRTQ